MKQINNLSLRQWAMLLVFMSWLQPSLVMAEPYFAVREGMKCSACHTNITGGGKRTDFGFYYPQSFVKQDSNVQGLSPRLGDSLSIGANFRSRWNYTRFPQAKSVENSTSTPVEFDDVSSFEVSGGNLYIETKLNNDISFYLDQQVAPEGGRTREAAVIWKNLAGGSYLKAGKFYLPYGLRLEDDGAFIREVTGFNFDNSDIGVEVGVEPGPFSFSLGFSNGTQGSGETNTDKQISFVGSYIQRGYRIGGSFSSNNAPNQLKNTSYNIFAGANYGDFTLLGEVDWIKNENGQQEVDQVATFLAVNYLLNAKTNLKLSYEHLDPNDDIDENERVRISLLAEMFINPYAQLRTGIRAYDAIPQNSIWNQDQFFMELNFFY